MSTSQNRKYAWIWWCFVFLKKCLNCISFFSFPNFWIYTIMQDYAYWVCISIWFLFLLFSKAILFESKSSIILTLIFCSILSQQGEVARRAYTWRQLEAASESAKPATPTKLHYFNNKNLLRVWFCVFKYTF